MNEVQSALLSVFTMEEIEAIARSLKHEIEGIEAAEKLAESKGLKVEDWEEQKRIALRILQKLKA